MFFLSTTANTLSDVAYVWKSYVNTIEKCVLFSQKPINCHKLLRRLTPWRQIHLLAKKNSALWRLQLYHTVLQLYHTWSLQLYHTVLAVVSYSLCLQLYQLYHTACSCIIQSVWRHKTPRLSNRVVFFSGKVGNSLMRSSLLTFDNPIRPKLKLWQDLWNSKCIDPWWTCGVNVEESRSEMRWLTDRRLRRTLERWLRQGWWGWWDKCQVG